MNEVYEEIEQEKLHTAQLPHRTFMSMRLENNQRLLKLLSSVIKITADEIIGNLKNSTTLSSFGYGQKKKLVRKSEF